MCGARNDIRQDLCFAWCTRASVGLGSGNEVAEPGNPLPALSSEHLEADYGGRLVEGLPRTPSSDEATRLLPAMPNLRGWLWP